MHAEFWHDRWRRSEIGFHEAEPNAMLVRHFASLALDEGQRVFVPLCGKTRDIGWLLAQGCRTCGVELSSIAVHELFEELGIEPEIRARGELEQFSADDIDIFVGDVFALTPQLIGRVDAIYDRAALVALPDDMRGRYATQLRSVTDSARQLLICFEYDQRLMEGPPFSITEDAVEALYSDYYEITRLSQAGVPGGLKGQCAATEVAWLLVPK
jgi:thiopurine S-methyltransferase